MRTAGKLQKTASTIIAGLIVGLGTGGFAHAQSSDAGQSAETTTRIFTMDEVYKSMFGPVQNDRLVLLRTQTPEVLWVTGIRAQIVGEDRLTPNSPEYFCHSNITMVSPQPVNRRILLGDPGWLVERSFPNTSLPPSDASMTEESFFPRSGMLAD